jgi:hypothetical protein
MAEKRWKVVERHISAMSLVALKLRHYEMVKPPTVTERFYRWRWTACLSAFMTTSFYTFNPSIIYGAGWATVEPTEHELLRSN